MKLNRELWTKEDYHEYLKDLFYLQDKKYQVFHQKLTKTKYFIIGIRVPLQRQIAKEIIKGNYSSFLAIQDNSYYECVNIRGFVLGYIKDIEELKLYLEDFLISIDNWAICDSFCSSLKIVKKHKALFLSWMKEWLKKGEFQKRVVYVLLLDYYVEKEYLPIIFALVNQENSEKYYVNMAMAWLICECYIQYREDTKEFILKNHCNSFTNKMIKSKIQDSFRTNSVIK